LRSLAIADIEGARATVTGTIADLDGTPRAAALKLDLKADDPRLLLNLLGVATVPEGLGGLTVTAQLDGDAKTLAVQGQGGSGGLAAMVKGSVTDLLGTPRIDLSAEASQTSLTGALALLGFDYRRPAGKQPVSAAFHATGDRHALTLDDLRLRIGSANATGHAAIALGEHSRLDLTLAADEVPLDAFLGASAPAATPAPAAAPAAPRPQAVAPNEPDAPKPVPRPVVDVGGIPAHFSLAPIELDWMHDWDGTLTLDAGALTWGALRMSQAAVALTLAGGKLSLDRFDAKLWGGDLTGSATLAADGALSCGAQLAHAALQQALLGVADLDLVEGSFDASATFTSAGHSLAEFIGRLSGSGSFAAHDGVLRGFDLKAAGERLKNPSPASLVTLLEAGAKGGQTRFSALTGTIKATDGVITTDDLTMTAEGGTMTASGTVNLPAYAVDARAVLHLAAAPQAPPLVMHIAGPLDNPRRVIDINPLSTWLARRGKAQ